MFLKVVYGIHIGIYVVQQFLLFLLIENPILIFIFRNIYSFPVDLKSQHIISLEKQVEVERPLDG